MRRLRRGALLAGVSASAILVMMAEVALAAWPDQAPVDAAATVDGSNTPYTSSGTVNGPTATSAGVDNGGWGYTSAGININAAGTTVNVTSGTVTGGTGGNGGTAAAGPNSGGDGGDSAGIYFKTNLTGVTINISQGATVQGGTGGNGGNAGGTGGTAGDAGSSSGVDIRGANAALNNSGTIRPGTAGSNGGANGGTASSYDPKIAAVNISGQGHATGATITNNATGQILGGDGMGIGIAASNATINNSGTISSSGAVRALDPHAIYIWNGISNTTILNSGTITATGLDRAAISSDGGSSSITNLANGTISGANEGSSIVLEQATAASTINNYGTLTGSIHTSSYGDQLNFYGGSLSRGDITGPTSGTAPTVSFRSGTTNIGGDIGYTRDNNTVRAVDTVNVQTGSTVNLIGTTDPVYLGQIRVSTNSGLLNSGTVNLGTYAVTVTGGAISGNGTIKTTIGSSSHGYIINDGNVGTDISAMTIVPVVSGRVKSGGTYLLMANYGGSAAAPTTVTSSGGVTWSVGVVRASGQTDSQGISYGTSNKDIILTVLSGGSTGQVAAGTNAGGFNSLANYSGSNSQLQTLSNALNNLTSDTDIQKAGAQLRPEINGGTTQASLGAVNQALGTIQVRTEAVRTSAADQTGVSSGESLRGLGTWAQGFGSHATQDRREGVDGYGANTYGLAFGADTLVSDSVRAGASFAYARTNVADSGSRDGSGQKINSYIATLYGTYTAPRWYVDGTLTYGWHSYDSTRQIAITGAPSETAKASFSGQQYGAKTEFGYPIALGKAIVTPIASLAYNRLDQDSYTETGTAAALTVNGSSTDSFRTGLGSKISASIGSMGGWSIRPNARVVWLHEFNGKAQDTTSTYVEGGSSFTTSGIKVAREHYDVGLGLDLVSLRNTTLSAKYDADLSDRYVSHTGSLQIRTEF